MTQIVLASNNPGKLKEFQLRFQDQPVSFVRQGDLGVDSVAETGLSFVENAIIKARYACQKTGLPALADDSGIEVDALQGEPGIYSARYSGEGASNQENNAKLLNALKDVPEEQRTARFQCLLVFMRHAKDPTPLICQGTWEGSIVAQPKGEEGFGYDPIFYVPSQQCTAAELAPEVKNVISHRGQAIAQLLSNLRIS